MPVSATAPATRRCGLSTTPRPLLPHQPGGHLMNVRKIVTFVDEVLHRGRSTRSTRPPGPPSWPPSSRTRGRVRASSRILRPASTRTPRTSASSWPPVSSSCPRPTGRGLRQGRDRRVRRRDRARLRADPHAEVRRPLPRRRLRPRRCCRPWRSAPERAPSSTSRSSTSPTPPSGHTTRASRCGWPMRPHSHEIVVALAAAAQGRPQARLAPLSSEQ